VKKAAMISYTLFPFIPFFGKHQAAQKVNDSVRTKRSERSVAIDNLCESAGTRYRDLAKYRALSRKRT
jgi:hypothetical protein